MFAGFFPAHYFANAYFPAGFFPHGSSSIKPSYFYHGVFPVRYYPDRYFPGEPAHAVTPPVPPPPTIFGGRSVPFRPQPRHVPPALIHALVELVLPFPRVRIRAEYLPPHVAASVHLDIPAVRLETLLATASPADIAAALQAVAPWVDVEQFLVDVFEPKRPTKSRADHDAWEENMLLEHYMLSLRGEH